jgi:hypothetical protein
MARLCIINCNERKGHIREKLYGSSYIPFKCHREYLGLGEKSKEKIKKTTLYITL